MHIGTSMEFSSPLWGGVGVVVMPEKNLSRPPRGTTPTLYPSPQGGGKRP